MRKLTGSLLLALLVINGCRSNQPPPEARAQADETMKIANEFCPDVDGNPKDDNCARAGEDCTVVEAEITVDKTAGDPNEKWVRFCLFEPYFTRGGGTEFHNVSGNYKWFTKKFKASRVANRVEKIRWCFPHVRSPGCIFFDFNDRSDWVGMGLRIWVWRKGHEDQKQLVFAGTRAEGTRVTGPEIQGFAAWKKTRMHPAVHYAKGSRLIMYFGRKKILVPDGASPNDVSTSASASGTTERLKNGTTKASLPVAARGARPACAPAARAST